jgi:hypothetical protein
MKPKTYWAVAYATDRGRHHLTFGCYPHDCQIKAEAEARAFAEQMSGTVFKSPTFDKVREYAESIGL